MSQLLQLTNLIRIDLCIRRGNLPDLSSLSQLAELKFSTPTPPPLQKMSSVTNLFILRVDWQTFPYDLSQQFPSLKLLYLREAPLMYYFSHPMPASLEYLDIRDTFIRRLPDFLATPYTIRADNSDLQDHVTALDIGPLNDMYEINVASTNLRVLPQRLCASIMHLENLVFDAFAFDCSINPRGRQPAIEMTNTVFDQSFDINMTSGYLIWSSAGPIYLGPLTLSTATEVKISNSVSVSLPQRIDSNSLKSLTLTNCSLSNWTTIVNASILEDVNLSINLLYNLSAVLDSFISAITHSQ